MGLLDRILGRNDGPPAHLTPNVTRVGSWQEWAQLVVEDLHGTTPARLYREQPHLRTVVSFIARNTAQLGLHVYERNASGDRVRSRTSPLARVLASPDGVMTTYELIYATVGDLGLYDRAHWYVATSAETSTGWIVRRIPPSWVTPEESTAFAVKSWRVTYGKESVVIPASNMLSFTGYSPTDPRAGSPTVEALRQTLQEQIEAAVYRSQTWKRGGRVSSVLERPADAPQWSDAAREAFREDWYSKYTGKGSKAGGTPILEDGMKLSRVDFNAQEQQFVEAAKLSMTTVAAAFHINPTMVGQNDGANYSNVREFRKMLYGDTLGPLVAQIEARVNAFLLPMLGVDPETYYVEFNIDEKLQGNFEEQSQALQTSTGAPWMTRNEARALRNLPALEGGDELVVPLNVLLGGQASPNDAGSQNRTGESSRGVAVKATRPPEQEDQAAGVVAEFFSRQSRSVLSRLGSGADWWDEERWDRELAGVLNDLQAATSSKAGREALRSAGIDPDRYDERRTVNYLAEVSRRTAKDVNGATRDEVSRAVDSGEDPGEVFDAAASERAGVLAASAVTFAAGFGAVEAARQLGGGRASKTWVVTSGNPRDAHAAMDGETVGIDEPFSNSLQWPASGGDPSEVANCRCEVVISVPD